MFKLGNEEKNSYRTNPIIAFIGGLFTIILDVVANNRVIGELQVLLTIILFLLCFSYYYIFKPRNKLVSVNTVLSDILETARISLGENFRVNIMRFIDEGGGGCGHLRFVCFAGVIDMGRIGYNITLNVPGAGEAYIEKKLVYTPVSKIVQHIDSYPKHIWSAPIISDGCNHSVLNIDTSDVYIHEDKIPLILNIARVIASRVAKYGPGRLSPIDP